MTTGLTYTTYQNQVLTMAALGGINGPSGPFVINDPNFTTILPTMIDYAELRIFRDLDLLASVTTSIGTLVIGTRQFSFPQFVTVQQLNVITPLSQTNPDSGTRNSLLPVTKEFLDVMYPDVTTAGLPLYMAPFLQNSTGSTGTTQTLNTFLVGPFPDAAYTCEIVGTYRPASLSGTQTTTFISQNLPDLFVMASMVYLAAYQRDFGRLSDDPQMAVTYESQYQGLLKGATVEEYRKKFESAAWSSKSPAVVATPTRG